MDRAEIRRLQKAAKEGNKMALASWATQLENSMKERLRISYEQAYQEEIQNSIDNIMTAVAYTLHFSENTRLGKKRLPDFMEDLFVTIDMFRTGEYKPEEYYEELKRNGVTIDTYDYSRIYKDNLAKLESTIDEYNKKILELTKNGES